MKNNLRSTPNSVLTSIPNHSGVNISIGPSSAGTGKDYTFNSSWSGITNIQSALKVNGTADFDGDITIKGRSITETINQINERLAILVPNEKLEQEWSELAELRQRYVELERELLEKQRTFDILKKSY